MDRTGIEKIIELAPPNIEEINGYQYTDKKLQIIEEPQVITLKFKTLLGLTEIIKSELSQERFYCPLILQIAEHDRVIVHSAINDSDRSREIPYISEAVGTGIVFDRHYDIETMLISLKSRFVETAESLELVKYLGNMTKTNEMNISDDGFSQSITFREGIQTLANTTLQSRIKLKPFRTFIEIDQPESEFIIRLFKEGTVALFEADGGEWKITARENIAKYLTDKLSAEIKDGKILIVQ